MEKIIRKEGHVKSFDKTNIHWELTAPESTIQLNKRSKKFPYKIPFALVMCDGVGCNHTSWKYLRRFFKDKYPLLNWYLRGHGLSEVPRNPKNLKIRDSAKDLLAVIKACGVRKAVLLGYSMGVQVILEFYKWYPDYVAALIPMFGTYKHPLSTFMNSNIFQYIVPYMHKNMKENPQTFRMVWKMTYRSPFIFKFVQNMGLVGKTCKPSDMQPYFNHLASLDLDNLFQMVEYMEEHSAEDILEEIDVPTLLIGGENDLFTPYFIVEEMRKLIPEVETLKIPAGTHVACLEVPELIDLRIEKFLRKHFGSAPGEKKKKVTKRTVKGTKKGPRKVKKG